MGDWVTVGRPEDVCSGALRGVQIGELWLALGRLDDGTLFAVDEWCSHEECQLSEGEIEDATVVCYCHSSAFDTTTGKPLNGPATDPIQVYETRVVDDALQVLVDAPSDDVRWTEWRL
jgi:3-phenylpropionate/trans-cinnamate dioxygenase ferredoxin subunit